MEAPEKPDKRRSKRVAKMIWDELSMHGSIGLYSAVAGRRPSWFANADALREYMERALGEKRGGTSLLHDFLKHFLDIPNFEERFKEAFEK